MSDTATKAAELLLAARRDPTKRLDKLPDALKPADQKAAYAIQQEVAKSFAGIGAWKVGAPGPDKPPICGPIPSAFVQPSPGRYPSKTYLYRGIEAEISFRLSEDLPPRSTPYSRDDILGAIAATHPSIEVLESRFVDPDAQDMLTTLADTQANGGFVYGTPVENWQHIDFANVTIEQIVDGKVQKTGKGNPAGDMIRLIVWLANEGAVWAGGLKAGQFITCGSWTGKAPVGASAKVEVRFAGVGNAEVGFG